MSYDHEMALYIQRYFAEEKKINYTIDEILQRPLWKRVYYFWKALEKYEGKPMSKMSLETIRDIYGD